MVSHRALAEIIAGIVLALFLALAGYELIQEHDARLQAETTQKSQDAAISQIKAANEALAKQNDQLAQESAANRQALAQATSALTAQRAAAVTPDQMTALIGQLSGIKPQIITIPGSTPGAPPQQIAEIPASQLAEVTDLATACTQCKLDRDSAQAQVVNLTQQNVNLKAQATNDAQTMADLKKESDAWKVAAKGGTFWHRLKHDALLISVSAGAGVGAGYALHH